MLTSADRRIVAGVVTPGSTPEMREQVSRLREQLSAGMRAYFPQLSWTLVEATAALDPASPADPNAVVIPLPSFGAHSVTYPAHGVPAKSNGYRAILEYAQRSRAIATVLLDPAQHGFDCTWVDALIRPAVHSRYDLVTPVYGSRERDQLLSGNLISPLFRALFGIPLKQPMGAELVLSARLVDRLLARHDWDSPAARDAPELWISFIACVERFRLAESAVGPSEWRTQGPRLDVQSSFTQIAGALLTLMEQYENRWISTVKSIDFDRFGRASTVGAESSRDDAHRLLESFLNASAPLLEHWRAILDPHTFSEIQAYRSALLAGEPDAYFGNAAWVRVVYEFAAAWKLKKFPRPQVLGLLTPLYRARAASFLVKTHWTEQSEVDLESSRLSVYFEALKPVLDRLWQGESVLKSHHGVRQLMRLEMECLKP
jgi:hypothetical protein